MSEPPTRPGYHHGDLRRALLDAALELVAEKGPDGVSMREAARRVGVSSGAPYRHFADVGSLMRELAVEGIARSDQAMQDRIAALDAPQPVDVFRAMGIAYVTFAVENPAWFRVMNTPEWTDPEADPRIAAAIEQSKQGMSMLLQGAVARGEMAGDPEMISLAARSLVYGLARLIVDGHLEKAGVDTSDPESLAIACTEVMGLGLTPRE